MRIFHASDSSPNAALASNIWHRTLYLPIVDLGHDVVKFDFDMRVTMRNLDWAKPPIRAYIEEHRPILEAALVEQVERAHRERPIDLFFSYFYDACCRPHVVEYIKSLGICTVNWYCNASYQLHLVDQISPAYDYCFAPEKFRFPDYRAIGAHPLYVREAGEPDLLHADPCAGAAPAHVLRAGLRRAARAREAPRGGRAAAPRLGAELARQGHRRARARPGEVSASARASCGRPSTTTSSCGATATAA